MGVSARVRLLLVGLGLASCQAHRAAVPLTVDRADAPRDASVYIDEQFVGLLGVVAARGVRLPEGEHRITVEKVGYFPWDQRVVSDRQPIKLRVELRKIPE
jgi:PEGA domain-containing protein